eukprot:TRINITY_DN8712_c0_g1_i1.p1 TRINITY_DN8712_c0_g1~~TRINITY_DN8712_c0_g1_i1.p1  ORF type:complete len:577 (-),score=144.64 TRINITY_DN8712_c0_g1_i1:39-1769(-)
MALEIPHLAQLNNYVLEATQSQEFAARLHGAQMIRRLLAMEHNPPIKEVIDTGVPAAFLRMLNLDYAEVGQQQQQQQQQQEEENENKNNNEVLETFTADQRKLLQFEAAWIITNICSGTSEQTQAMVEMNAIQVLVNVLNKYNGAVDDTELWEQCIWALGNIAGDSKDMRDRVLACGGHSSVIKCLRAFKFEKPKLTSLFRNGAWTLSNLVRGNPLVPVEKTLPIISLVADLINVEDTEIQTDSLWCLAYFTDTSKSKLPCDERERMDTIMKLDLIKPVMNFMQSESTNLCVPSLRMIGNIASASDEIYTQKLLDSGVLESLPRLDHQRTSTRKEVLWLLSNIAAGNIEQIHRLIESGTFAKILQRMNDESQQDVKVEALWCFANAVEGDVISKKDVCEALIEMGSFKFLVQQLELPAAANSAATRIAALTILNLFEHGKERVRRKECPQNDVVPEFLAEGGNFETLIAIAKANHLFVDESDIHSLAFYTVPIKVSFLRSLWKSSVRNDGHLLKQSANQALSTLYYLDESLNIMHTNWRSLSRSSSVANRKPPGLLGNDIFEEQFKFRHSQGEPAM